jgi:hypothetical protein
MEINISLHRYFKVFDLYHFISIKSERERNGVCTHNAETRARRTQAALHERFDFLLNRFQLHLFDCDLQLLLRKFICWVLIFVTKTSVGLGGI